MLPSQLKRTLITIVSISLIAVGNSTYAQPNKEGRRQGPPQEAIDACETLSENDVCSFTGRRGEVEGTCIIPKDKEVLACAPEKRPHMKEESYGNWGQMETGVR